MRAEFVWPDPVPVPDVDPIAEAVRPGPWSVERHRRHADQGEVGCPMCVITVDGFKTDNCRTCTAPIVWAVTADGNRMPVDATPDPAGNVVIGRAPGGVVMVAVLDQEALFDDGVRRTSHFATCPDAAGWRRSR